MLSFENIIDVRFSDIDMYGIIHHSKYFLLLEEARMKFIRSSEELTKLFLEDETYFLPLIHADITYKNSLAVTTSQVKVKTKIEIVHESKVKFSYELSSLESKRVIVKATTLHCVVKGRTELLYRVPSKIIKILAEDKRTIG